MSCREYRSGLIEWGRGRAPGEAARQVLSAHLDQCSECTRFLETQQALTAAISGLIEDPIPPAGEFFAPVMAEFDRVHPPRRTRVVPIRWALSAALAAAILLVVILAQHRAPRPAVVKLPVEGPLIANATLAPGGVTSAVVSPPPKRSTATHPATFRAAAPEPEEPFYPIPFTAPLAPGEWTRVERMRIPVGALIAVGFHVIVSDPAATVEADVLVSQDGRARAVRPLSLSNSN